MIEGSLRVVPADEREWLGPLDVRTRFAHPERPLEIDLGCGKGRFLLAHAAKHPEVNFWGIDRMLRRIRKIDNRARRMDLENVRLSRIEAYYGATYWVPTAAVRTYYIFFPDPWPKARHEGHRLFNARFLEALWRTLAPGGVVHVATDHLPYHEQLCGVFREFGRFEEAEVFVPAPDERTDFEQYYIEREGKPIGRLSVRKPAGAE